MIPIVSAINITTTDEKVLNFTYNSTVDFYLNSSLVWTSQTYLFTQNEGLYNLTIKYKDIEKEYLIQINQNKICQSDNIIDKLSTFCYIKNNGICEDGEFPFLSKDCQIGDFKGKGWFFKIIALVIVSIIIINMGLGKNKDIAVFAIIMIFLFLAFYANQEPDKKTIDLNTKLNISSNNTIPHIDLEETPSDKVFNFISNLPNKFYSTNPIIGWLIVIVLFTIIYGSWEGIVDNISGFWRRK